METLAMRVKERRRLGGADGDDRRRDGPALRPLLRERVVGFGGGDAAALHATARTAAGVVRRRPPHLSGGLGTHAGRDSRGKHAENATCAACHRKMDPLGFALDNYSVVGLWREKFGDQPVDESGELPTGEKLNGVGDLKQFLLARKVEFVRNLTEQMLTYALGRELDYYGDCPVQQIA